jgi:Helix-hairpin-helix domain
MPRRDDPKSNRAGQSGDDFQKIAGIGPVLALRLWNAGILTYDDLARRTPAEIAATLADVAGISAERIASQNWTGQARELGEPPPEASVPSQHYAAFHIEFLLESDNRVRRTKVHHHQTDARDAWPGWDEGRLLSFLRDRIQPPAAAMAADTPGPEQAHMQTKDQGPASTRGTPTSQPSPSVPEHLPSLSLSIEELAPVRGGQRSYLQSPDDPNSVRLTMRISSAGTLTHDAFDFSATIATRTFEGHHRSPLGTTQGVIRVSDPLSVEVPGRALPVGLYRLVATVDIYPAGHSPKQQPLHRQSASGDLMGVADTPPGSASAVA